MTPGLPPAVSEYRPRAGYTDNSSVCKTYITVICLFLVVVLRSYMGLSFDFAWSGIGAWGIVLICAVVFGKTLGGFIADRLGMQRATWITLGFAAIMFALSVWPLPGIAAVFAFNMTMPITLWAMARVFPGAKGFSFGLLTFALFLGFLPVYFGIEVAAGISNVWFYPAVAVMSAVLLLFGLKIVQTRNR